MLSSVHRDDPSYITLGERRKVSDLARFSLDLSWARTASDGARSRAYPSPPMSGSPPLPPRSNPDTSDRGHGGYGSIGQNVFRGVAAIQTTHPEFQEQSRGPPLRPYQPDPPTPASSYASYQPESISSAQQPYPQHLQHMVPQQHQPYPTHIPQPPPFAVPERQPIREAPEYSLPKAQRKTKGHVASACVPCKRAHLRCDAQRPCSRCLSNGKEDACVDVQHKKRGRPRLRDEREPRYEGMGPSYPPPPESSMRRPLSLYSPGDASMGSSFGDIQRSGSYRVLKSQAGGSAGPMAPRHLEQALSSEANIYGASLPPTPRMLTAPEPAYAFLTLDMQVAKATQTFAEAAGLQSVIARKLHDMVSVVDRDKVFRLQRVLEDERREREPNYLPPIYPKFEENRIIQSVGFGQDEMSQYRIERPEMLTFQGPEGHQMSFQARFGLAKKESTYFIILFILIPATPQPLHQPPSSPYSRESISRDSQYGYQTSHQAYPNPTISPYMPNPPFGGPRSDTMYRTPGAIGPNNPSSTNLVSFPQPQPRADFRPGRAPYQTPRSELPPAQTQRQHELQLPPIRDQRADLVPEDPSRRRDDRSGRLDIVGLLERPDPGRRVG